MLNYSVYTVLKAGSGFYNSFTSNSSFPSLSNMRRVIKKKLQKIPIGFVDTGNILKFLECRNYPKHLVVSCDETRVLRQVDYDFESDSLVGLTAPIHPVTGFPNQSFMPTNTPSEIIETLCSHSHATYIEVMVAKPMMPGATSFCISVIPTDRKYTKSDKAKQFTSIASELSKVGIKVEGFASDGDEKYFGAQKSLIEFGKPFLWFQYTLNGNPHSYYGAAQDYLHMLQKIRWRAFDQACDLSFNNFPINSSFLKILLCDDTVSRETFGLTHGDVENKDKSNDKMNCKVTLKLCSWKLIEGLRMVQGSDGLQQYLRLMTMLHEAYILDESKITLEMRLFNIIYVVSFCRRWKSFVIKSKGKAANFLTPNAWACIEVNLVFFVRLLLSGYGDMVYLCNSQPCEETFRTMRSFGTWGFTQINFSMSVALNLLSKVNLLLDVTNTLSMENFKFAEKFACQSLPKDSSFVLHFLPDHQINEIIAQAIDCARTDALKFGMNTPECNVGAILKIGDLLEDLLSHTPARGIVSVPIIQATKSTVFSKNIVSVKNLHYIDEPQTKRSHVARLKSLDTYETIIISKQQFLNQINMESCEKISADRTHRFMMKPLTERLENRVDSIAVKNEISIGDWVGIKNPSSNYGIGQVIKFRRFEPNFEASIYQFDCVSLSEINVRFLLAPIYSMDLATLVLEPVICEKFLEMKDYEFTVSRAMIDLENYRMKTEFSIYVVDDIE